MKKIRDDWWPDCFRHYMKPLVSETDNEITVAEILSHEKDGKKVGDKLFYTALVPLEGFEDIINVPGGIGEGQLGTSGPHPCVADGESYEPRFWIRGSDSDQVFEPLIQSWQYHKKTVIVPENGFLMTYGLVPRFADSMIFWDDPSKPKYDVVKVIPMSTYQDLKYTEAKISILKDYLEDYLSLRQCVAVASFYEDKWISHSEEIDKILDGSEHLELKLPGRSFTILKPQTGSRSSYYDEKVFIRVWASVLLFKPKNRPITDDEPSVLNWPGFSARTTYEDALKSRHLDQVYVEDKVLQEFEGKSEYQIHPLSGSVNYDDQWSVSYCHRVGRSLIALEIKKLYEGCPTNIIEHWNKYAIDPQILESIDSNELNISLRAQNLIYTYLDLEGELGCFALSLGLEDDDFYSLNRKELNYHGWWTYENLKPLGYVAPKEINEEQFLNRCKHIYKIFEGLKESKIREIIKELGFQDQAIKEYRSLKLLGVLIRFIEDAVESGLDFFEDKESIVERCDIFKKTVSLEPLFALRDLRIVDSHKLGVKNDSKVDAALKVFGIDRKEMKSGWGLALDKVYDQVEESISQVVSKIQKINV
jgi:hypothetical protein